MLQQKFRWALSLAMSFSFFAGSLLTGIGSAFAAGTGFGENSSGWAQDAWGTNSSKFMYPVAGRSGNTARKVEITQYTNGDAKWAYQHVTAKPGTKYSYTDYYRSSVESDIVVEYLSDGAYSYEYVTSLAASSVWKSSGTIEFTTPSGITSMTVFHLISGKGYLETDEFTLAESSDTTPDPDPDLDPAAANDILNPSLENGSGSAPTSWQKNKWGTNTTKFTWPVAGSQGQKAAKVEITSYSSGDAKWYFDDVKADSTKTYALTHDYMSTASTNITVRYTLGNGSYVYQWYETLPASSSWKKHTLNFTPIAGAVSFTLFHTLGAKGTLSVDNYTLTAKGGSTGGTDPNTFAAGMVSLTFDDGWKTQYLNALPILQQAGIKGSFYINTEPVLGGWGDYMTPAQVKGLQTAGQEVGSHTRTHAHLTQISSSQLQAEIEGCIQELKGMGITNPATFAYPYGEKNSTVIQAVIDAGHTAARGVESGYNTPSTNLYNLQIQEVNVNTSLSQIKNWIDQAKKDKTWLILMLHQVENNGGAYSTTPETLTGITNYLIEQSVKTVTVTEGISMMN